MKLTPKPPLPEDPEPLARIASMLIPLVMEVVLRQDRLFFDQLDLEQHLRRINAGFVLTDFAQASVFKSQTHAMVEGINAMIDTLELRSARAHTTHENHPK